MAPKSSGASAIGFAAERAEHAVEQHEEPLRAGIDHAGFLQHGQQLRRAGDGIARSFDGCGERGVGGRAVAPRHAAHSAAAVMAVRIVPSFGFETTR